MTTKHFDVVVLGRSLGALTAAALLARRSFTVLVLGQGALPSSYALGERQLRRRSFHLLGTSSPLWSRVLAELAQSQSWRRRARTVSPMLQGIVPGARLDLPPDMGLLLREVEREYPEVLRIVDELYVDLARVNAAADEAFVQDAVWPPGTFWERRKTHRVASTLPHVRAEPDADLLSEFPVGHPYRQLVTASVQFATDLSALPPPFAVARLHGAWTRGVVTLGDGEQELEDFLVERLEANGGQFRPGDRATALQLRRGAASGVVLEGDETPISASFVLSDSDGERLAALAGGQGIHKRAQREWPRITSGVGRFVVSILASSRGVPRPLAHTSLLLPGPGLSPRSGRSQADRPAVLLQRAHPLRNEEAETLLVAEALLPQGGGLPLVEARERVLEVVLEELPFLSRHLLVVDSVHDGLPVWVYERGRREAMERRELQGGSVRAEPMVRQLEVDPPGYLGLSGEPVRGPVENTLLVGRSVLPALGQEGELLAAYTAAQLVTRTDPRREKMRRQMWSRVEFG